MQCHALLEFAVQVEVLPLLLDADGNCRAVVAAAALGIVAAIRPRRISAETDRLSEQLATHGWIASVQLPLATELPV